MTGLLQNEWIKIRKQTGYRVFLILFAVVVLLVAPVSKLFSELMNGLVLTPEKEKENYEEMADYYRENGDTAEAEYYTGLADSLSFFIEEKIGTDSWRYRSFAEDYQSICVAAQLCAAVTGGRLEAEKLIGRAYTVDGSSYYLVPEEAVDENNRVTDAFDASETLRSLETLKKTEEDKILHADEMAAVRDRIAERETRVAAAKATVSELEEAVRKSPDNQGLRYKLDSAKRTLDGEEEVLLAYRQLLERNAGCDSWQYRAVTEVLVPAVAYYPATVVMPEEVYREQNNSGTSYATYLRGTEEVTKATEGAVSTVWYSLSNNVPLYAGTESTSVRSTLLSGFDTICGWISLFLIVVAVLTVSSEYTSGTIRLLLIRPKKRSKIVLSKYFCVALVAAGMVFGALVLHVIMTVILNGPSDLFLPKLFGYGDRVLKLNGVLYLIVYALLKLVGILLPATFGFLLATLIRKSALPIILSILGSSVASGIQSLARFIQYTFSFRALDFTILTNFDPASRLVAATDIVTSYDFSNYLCNRSVCLPASVAVTVLHVALIAFFAVLVFCKREVRS